MEQVISPLTQAHVDKFVNEVNATIAAFYKEHLPNLTHVPLEVQRRNKYIRLWHTNRVWGFIALYDGMIGKKPVKAGDLLKAASINTPAAGSRGNIIDNTARYGVYGPVYLY